MHAISYLALIIAAIFAVQAILRSGYFAVHIWPHLVFGYRARYSILLILSPFLLGLNGVSPSSMLHTLLVLRDESCPEGSKFFLSCLGLAPNQYYLDLMSITGLSLLTVCLGFAELRIIELYSEERLGRPTNLLLTHPLRGGPAPHVPTISKSWPTWKYVVLLLSGWSLPCFVVCVSVHQQGIPQHPAASWPGDCFTSLLAMIYGTIAATGVVLSLILIEVFVPGKEIDRCGLLPLEDLRLDRLPFWPYRRGQTPFWVTDQWNQSPRLMRSAALWFRGPGYTHRTNTVPPIVKFNSGHVQLALVAYVALLVYAWWTYSAYRDTLWTDYRWPTLWYAQLLIFFIGVQLSGFAFWLDRFGVPPTVIIVGWVSLMYYVGGTDNYYQLGPKLTEKERARAVQAFQKEGTKASRHVFVSSVRDRLEEEEKTGKMQTSVTDQAKPAIVARPLLWSTLCSQKWQKFAAGGSDRKPETSQPYKTLVIVTAAGGGIQASAWAARVLTGLDAEFEGLTGSIGLISGVSGGSVGTMYYLGHRGPRSMNMLITPDEEGAINTSAGTSLLEPVGWGAAFPDLVRNVVPGLAPEFIDRGWALEAACWNRMGRNPRDRILMQDLRMLDLAAAFEEGRMPAVIFNATAVETGQRVMISSTGILDFNPQAELVNTPIEWFRFYRDQYNQDQTKPLYRSVEPGSVNPRVSTAVRLSASFSYAAPVARPSRAEVRSDDSDFARQARLHLCDGGYSSNSGLTSVITALQSLMEQLASTDLPATPFDRILVVRIEPFPPTIAQYSRSNDGLVAQFAGPMAAMANARVSSQAERDDIDAQLLSCIGRDVLSRAVDADWDAISYAPTELQDGMLDMAIKREQDLKQRIPSVDLITIQFEDKVSKVDPPLSWKLIPTAARAIKSRWQEIVAEQTESANKVTDSKALSFRDFPRFFNRRPKTKSQGISP